MKKVEAVIQGFKADEVREALANEEIPRITIFEVKGAGSHQGTQKEYRGAPDTSKIRPTSRSRSLEAK